MNTNAEESLNVYPLPEVVYIPIHEWEEEDIVIVIKDEAAWHAVGPGNLNWDIGITLDAPRPTEDAFKKLVKRCDGMGEIVYAIGDGAAVDAAKYVAQELDMALICVPSALSTAAFWGWSSRVQDNGIVHDLETLPPEIMLLDFGLIRGAPAGIRTAGIVDVLSIATARFDWALAEQKGKNPAHEIYEPAVANLANAVLQNALDGAEAAGRGDEPGLRGLANTLALSVYLNSQALHSRVSEGSEHFFAYCAEDIESRMDARTGPHTGALYRPHAEYVAAGILLMAERQGQDVGPLRKAMQAANVPIAALPQSLIDQTLRELPDYVRKNNLPYGIAWEL